MVDIEILSNEPPLFKISQILHVIPEDDHMQ